MKTIALKDQLHADTFSKRGNVYTARWGFFYTHGKTSEKYVERVKDVIKTKSGNRQLAKIIDHAEVWKPFRGGASTANSSHFYVKFEIVSNNELVESVNIMNGKKIMIPASQLGTCCDPGTERYWTM